jgi:hypothetical protein
MLCFHKMLTPSFSLGGNPAAVKQGETSGHVLEESSGRNGCGSSGRCTCFDPRKNRLLFATQPLCLTVFILFAILLLEK